MKGVDLCQFSQIIVMIILNVFNVLKSEFNFHYPIESQHLTFLTLIWHVNYIVLVYWGKKKVKI